MERMKEEWNRIKLKQGKKVKNKKMKRREKECGTKAKDRK